MANELKPVRRIVTGAKPDGTATIEEDRLAPTATTVAARPGYRVTSLWVTGETPAAIAAADSSATHKGLLPPKGGALIPMIDIPPEPKDAAERVRQQRATFGSIYTDLARKE